jgi:hypothetical protein
MPSFYSFLVGELITKLPTRLVERSVPIALYDFAWALGVAKRLAPGVDVAAAGQTYARLTEAWNADQIRVLRAAADAARQGRAATDALLAAELPVVRAHDAMLLRACDDALRDVERALSRVHGRQVRAHARGRLLGGLAFSMGLAACSPESRPAADASVADATVDGFPDVPFVCADDALVPESYPMPIHYDCTCLDPPMPATVQLAFDERGEIVAVRAGNGDPLPSDIEQCFLDLVKAYCCPSYAGMTLTTSTCHSWIA